MGQIFHNFLCRQFENEANAEVHVRTTAREILADFGSRRLDYWVTGAGTGGTLKGVGRVLAEERPDTRIIVCEPDNAPVLGSGLPQRRAADGGPSESHPLFRPHLMQGWSPDFIPKLTEDAVAMKLIDRILPINGEEALRMARDLARQEGIFLWDLGRRHLRRCLAGRPRGGTRQQPAVHAARHRGALSLHAALRGHRG